MANIVYIASSLDGFIALPNGDMGWLNNVPNEENSDYGYYEFLKRIDGILMGRNTYETVLEFGQWPYTQPVFVLSNTLKIIPEVLNGKAEIVNGELEDILDKLKMRGINNIYIDGGKTIQSFLKEDLIDEMIITTVSILLGEGISLFGEIKRNLKFNCEKVEHITPYLVKHYYKRDRDNWEASQ